MIVNLHGHPGYQLGVTVVHAVPDFYATDPANHPVTVKYAEYNGIGHVVRYINATFVFSHKGEDGTLNYVYKEKTQ